MNIESSMSLGRDWAGEDVAGWIATEKFDGVRVRWDGSAMWTRSGRRVNPPEIFTAGLPAIHLDCEIWGGYGPAGYEAARGAANRGVWDDVKIIVFDLPHAHGSHLDRLKEGRMLIGGVNPRVRVVSPAFVRDIEDARKIMSQVHARGGEGIILRQPDVGYVTGRSGFLKLTR